MELFVPWNRHTPPGEGDRGADKRVSLVHLRRRSGPGAFTRVDAGNAVAALGYVLGEIGEEVEGVEHVNVLLEVVQVRGVKQ